MSGVPPEEFVAYPRAVSDPDSADRLEALAKGYFGLNYLFLANVGLSIGCNVLRLAAGRPASAVATILECVVISFLSFGYTKKIGFGMGWSAVGAAVASFFLGVSGAFCCGIVGYVFLQNMALKQMSRLGLAYKGFLGLRNADVAEKLAELRGGSTPPTQP